MVDRARLPEGLADMPPGPELATTLAAIDPTALNGHDLVALAPAYVKLISHLQAGLATVLNQAQHSPPGDADSPVQRTEQPHQWAEIDIAAKLHWTAGKAGYELPRARIFVDALTCLEDEAAAQVAEQVIARGAGRWNTRQLSGRLRRAVIAHDPAAAARKQRQRLSDRFVQAEPHPEGTANLYGMNLPPERVHTIMERIAAIARTAKRQGDQRSVHQLAADTFCDLLAGTGIGATPPGPVTNPQPPAAAADATPAEPADQPEHAEAGVAGGRGEPAQAVVPLPGPRRGVVELTAPLSTLIGLTQAPGTLAGWGPVIADIVRQIVVEHPEAQWRFSLYDDLTGNGQLAYHGITPAPAHPRHRLQRRRRRVPAGQGPHLPRATRL